MRPISLLAILMVLPTSAGAQALDQATAREISRGLDTHKIEQAFAALER